jgi:hypothetical protein
MRNAPTAVTVKGQWIPLGLLHAVILGVGVSVLWVPISFLTLPVNEAVMGVLFVWICFGVMLSIPMSLTRLSRLTVSSEGIRFHGAVRGLLMEKALRWDEVALVAWRRGARGLPQLWVLAQSAREPAYGQFHGVPLTAFLARRGPTAPLREALAAWHPGLLQAIEEAAERRTEVWVHGRAP